MTIDRNAERRAEYRVKRRAKDKAKPFARMLADLLNGKLILREYLEWAEEWIPVREEQNWAYCRQLAEYLDWWKKANYKLTYGLQEKIAPDLERCAVSLTPTVEGLMLAVYRRPTASQVAEEDLPPVPLYQPPLTEEEVEAMHERELDERENEGRHVALRHFLQYIQSTGSDSVRRCERPSCHRYFVQDDPRQVFCSPQCAKMEHRKHSSARGRAALRRKYLVSFQAEIDALDGGDFVSPSEWKNEVVTKVNRLYYEAGVVFTAKFVTQAVRVGDLKPPLLKPPVEE
jgi:hypothetical protein